jgi:hypothetical protein
MPTVVAWGAALVAAAGVFMLFMGSRGGGGLAMNRRRRHSRRRSRRMSANRRRRHTRRVSRNRLSEAKRAKMHLSEFAIPERRSFPIDTKRRARAAIAYLHMGRVGSKHDYLRVRNAIIRRYGMRFWHQYGAPAWAKVEKAKRSRAATRSHRRRTRRVAANRRR